MIKCDKCGFEFTRRDSLTRHSKRCQAVKSIKTGEGSTILNADNDIRMTQSMVEQLKREVNEVKSEVTRMYREYDHDMSNLNDQVSFLTNHVSDLLKRRSNTRERHHDEQLKRKRHHDK